MKSQNEYVETKEIWTPCKYIRQGGTVEIFSNYEVSNLGRIRSLNYRRSGKPRVRELDRISQSNGTYYYAALMKDKKIYSRRVHRIVLSSFDPKGYFRGAVVDHIDSDPSNNRLSNLRWVTQQENVSTSHYKALQVNHPIKSRKVKVTFLNDGCSEIFPSTHEAERSLGLPMFTVSSCIYKRNGLYKKLNLLFEYI